MQPQHTQSTTNKLEEYRTNMQAEQQRRNRDIELRLSKSTPFKRNDANQSFYRKIDEYPQQYLNIKRLGWKIKDLSREQQELAMVCFSHLSNQGRFPIFFFTNDIENSKGQALKSLWMETSIFSSSQSVDFYDRGKHRVQVDLLLLCQNSLLPLFQSFIQSHISWNMMVQPNFKEQQVIQAFHEQVAHKMAQIMDNYAKRQ